MNELAIVSVIAVPLREVLAFLGFVGLSFLHYVLKLTALPVAAIPASKFFADLVTALIMPWLLRHERTEPAKTGSDTDET